MKDYLAGTNKSLKVKKLLNQAADILSAVGIPLDNLSLRRIERMTSCFCAVAGVSKDWAMAQGADDGVKLKTREIIPLINKYFEENISSGSYDDIRRRDLRLLTLGGLIINPGAQAGSAPNDPTRGYAVSTHFKDLIRLYGTADWELALQEFLSTHRNISDELARKRELDKIPAVLPNGKTLSLAPGEHNQLQKAIVEEFVPRFAPGAEILYLGDTAEKILHIEKERLEELGFFVLAHGDLPDILAYIPEKNWLYLIEAVHSSGPIGEVRMLELKEQLRECSAELIFVTAFLTKEEFRKWTMEIAWESEVWLAEVPDHLIHFDGQKFLGPY